MVKRPPHRKTAPRKPASTALVKPLAGYHAVLADVTDLLESARRASARAVNLFLTATYWQQRRVGIAQ